MIALAGQSAQSNGSRTARLPHGAAARSGFAFQRLEIIEYPGCRRR
jgi:hypothetical protein